MPEEIKEGTVRRSDAELRSVVCSVRLKQSTVDLVSALAATEQRTVADMLRLLIQDGYRTRVDELESDGHG